MAASSSQVAKVCGRSWGPRRSRWASNAHLQRLQGWLASRGLAPYDPQQNPDRGKETDLERLSRVHGTGFDRAYLKVMTARHWVGLRMATAEVRDGVVSEVRMLAKEMRATAADPDPADDDDAANPGQGPHRSALSLIRLGCGAAVRKAQRLMTSLSWLANPARTSSRADGVTLDC